MAAFEEIDVHGMTRQQAIAAVDAKLRRCRGEVYRLRVIHGYNDYRMAKSIEESIDFAAKRQVWQRMIL